MEDRQGVLWAVWESSRSANWDIYGRRLNGTTWLAEERLTNNTSSDLNPAIAQLGNGTMLLVWASDRSGDFSLYSKRFKAGVWSGEERLTSGPGRDSTPSLLQSRNGTLWVFWTRQIVSGRTVIWDIYYRTYTNGVWSLDIPLLTSTASEIQPTAFESDDGTIWVSYASGKSGNQDIFYKTFKGSWSPEAPLTFSKDDDRQPWIMQDFNGTLWVFWARCVQSGAACQDDIFYVTSSNLGVSWSLEVQYTFDPQGVEIFDSEPAALHAWDKRIYLFWVTSITGDGGDFDVYVSTSSPIPIHDVALMNATSFPTSITVGGVVKVNITAANPGDYTETLRIDGYYEGATRVLFNSTSLTLPPGRSTRVQVSWNTNGVPAAIYNIIIVLQPVTGESLRRQTDNTLEAGRVTLLGTIPGDVDGNGRVDILDAAILASKYGNRGAGPEDINQDCSVNILDAAIMAAAYGTRPGDPKWNPLADVDGNGRVDILDAAMIAIKYGTHGMGPVDVNGDCVVDILDAAILAFWYGTTT